MRAGWFIVLVLCSFAGKIHADSTLRPDAPHVCDPCDEWNAAQEPFRVFGNTWYVGVAGLSAILITSEDGLILLDGGLPQSAPRIDENIRKLGFRTERIRLIVNSHAHYDHAGGIAALERASRAVVAASAEGARAMKRGEPVRTDPQYAFGRKANRFPRVRRVRVVEDGEVLRVGELEITAHLTPGHTPGGTTWTWRSCEQERCLDIVYADSFSPVSAPGFRFTGDDMHPGIVDRFRRSISVVDSLPCDILLTVHPGFSGMDAKLERRARGEAANPFVDPQACRVYAADSSRRLDKRVEEEKK